MAGGYSRSNPTYFKAYTSEDSRLPVRQTRRPLRWSAEAQLFGSNRGRQPHRGPGRSAEEPPCGARAHGAASTSRCPRTHAPARQPQQERGRPPTGVSMLPAPENVIQTRHDDARPPPAFVRRKLRDSFEFLSLRFTVLCHHQTPPQDKPHETCVRHKVPRNTGPLKTCDPLKTVRTAHAPQMSTQRGLLKGFRAAQHIFRICLQQRES